MTRSAGLHHAEIADPPGPVRERAQAMLDELHDRIPFAGAWMALAGPDGIACGIDVLRALGASAVMVGGARAGVVLLPGRGVIGLPRLPEDELLSPGSALVPAARDVLEEAEHASFLWPRGDRRTPDGFVQVTVLACDQELHAVASGIVVLSPAPHLRGLTPRELEVLGHMIEGCSNLEIARALGVAPRTVAAHVEHILVKLDASSRTLAAVRAERAGLYVPLAGAGDW